MNNHFFPDSRRSKYMAFHLRSPANTTPRASAASAARTASSGTPCAACPGTAGRALVRCCCPPTTSAPRASCRCPATRSATTTSWRTTCARPAPAATRAATATGTAPGRTSPAIPRGRVDPSGARGVLTRLLLLFQVRRRLLRRPHGAGGRVPAVRVRRWALRRGLGTLP